MLDKQFFQKINDEVVLRYRIHIFGSKSGGKGAKDVYGKEYPNYVDKGKRKQLGTGSRQSSKYKDSKAPVFSGDLMKDFQLRKTKESGFAFGTTIWGSKVKSLADLERYISTSDQPLPKEIINYIITEAKKYTTRRWKKRFRGGTFGR